ncbi:MAG: thioesterase family protein [Aeromicrobium sp.]|uniref:acyl-CoA thioesterase n=1 Tax=Aeromicrobium sp. TaxID=1871063 RepID=UPI0039E61F63
MNAYRLPMRWADLDQLGHVNNVVYLAYAAEARAALVAQGELDPALRPVTTAIDFYRPLLLSRRPVIVEQRLDGDVLEQSVTQDVDGETVEFAAVRSQLGTPAALGAPRIDGPRARFCGRRGDVDESGHVDAVRVFEYFQEARIIAMAQGWSSGALGRMVVARLEVDYGLPVPWRSEPWDMVSTITHIGSKSFTLECEWRDGPLVLARNRAVLVAFDVETQSSRPMSDAERAYLDDFSSLADPTP